jgi:hypothetical protein
VSCVALASTGSPLLALVGAAALTLTVGIVVLVLGRSRRRRIALAVVLAVAVALSAGGASAQAASGGCPADPAPVVPVSVSDSPVPVDLTWAQLSVNTELAPGVAPAPILGRLTNPTENSVYAAFVVVSITTVRKRADAVAGTCDASDYLLVDPTMALGVTIAPGQSVSVSGASIGFDDKSVDQNACKGATVELGYVIS